MAEAEDDVKSSEKAVLFESPVQEDHYKRPKMSDEDKKRLADTNMENYGGAEHRELRRSTAAKERAWRNCGDLKKKNNGDYLSEHQKIEIWRIEKFKVKKWPKERYGEFHKGDSYIVLNSYTDPSTPEKMKYNVHFWLGAESTQDEMGTAAYKTVELDDYLGDLPVQFREVEGHEHKEFMGLFSTLTILEGGVDSGFRHVEAEEYDPRLLHVTDMHGKIKSMDRVRIDQVPTAASSLNDHDSFILDLGDRLFCFHPLKCSWREKFKSGQIMNQIAHDRHGKVKKTYTIDWTDKLEMSHVAEFWQILGGKPERLTTQEETELKEQEEMKAAHIEKIKVLWHVSDESGNMETVEVGRDVLSFSLLDNTDAFILDLGDELFVWVGSGANKSELKEAMAHGVNLLKESGRPIWVPITRIVEGREPVKFKGSFTDWPAIE